MKKAFFAVQMLVVALVFCPVQAKADSADGVSFTLVQADLTGGPGSTLTWEYDVTNNSGGTIYGLYVNSNSWQYGTPDASVFDGFGAGVADGSSLIGPLYSFTADPSVPGSFNSGSFDLGIYIDGGSYDGSVIDLFSPYSATITPEPPPMILLLTGVLALVCLSKLAPQRQ